MKKSRYILLTVGLTGFLYHSTFAQNLIPNGSFEEFKKTDNPYAPKIITNLAGGWEAFTTSQHKFYQPWIRVSGKRTTNPEPDGYVAMCCDNFQAVKDKQMIKSFFQVPLNDTLYKDSLYQLNFFYRIIVSSINKVTEDSLIDERFVEFCLLDKKLKNAFESDLIPAEYLNAMLPKGTYFKDYRSHPIKWSNSSCIYKANGNEKYLLFGIFKTNFTKYWCILEFDKLELKPLGKSLPVLVNGDIGTSIVMDNILFETDKSILKETSYDALNTLIVELIRNSNLKLEISGHTDNSGTENYNKELSENRAKAVVEYLVQKGIEKERLSFKGYGSSKPIADNETEKGKAKNRRVEIKILEK